MQFYPFKPANMEDTPIPYELPETENHSFFFIDQRVETSFEAKLHRHDGNCITSSTGTGPG